MVTTPFAAPNAMLTFTPPDIPCTIFKITDYGAKGDGTTPATMAFAQAVMMAKAAGGVVDVPPGKFLTGAIQLDTKVELHLEAGATILFSQTITDYPTVLTRWEGLDVMNFSPFIYALNATDVAVTGPGPQAAMPGIIDGQGSTWWGWKTGGATPEDQRIYDYYVSKLLPDGTLPIPLPAPPVSAKNNGLRPTLIECNNCTNFLIDGIQTQNAPYWGIHPLYSTNVIVRNSHITSNQSGANGDGIDVDSSKNVLIENNSFATSDDIITVKSGLDEDGIAVGKPTEEVVIRNITATIGHSIAVGSETSGGISNVLVTADMGKTNNLMAMQYLFRIKTLAGRGGTIQNIWDENATGTCTKAFCVEVTSHYGSPTIPPHNTSLIPVIKNVTFQNVMGDIPKACVDGATNVTFTMSNIVVTATSGCP